MSEQQHIAPTDEANTAIIVQSERHAIDKLFRAVFGAFPIYEDQEPTVPPISTGNVESVPTSKRPTPRTDRRLETSWNTEVHGDVRDVVLFARGLERELAEANDTIEHLRMENGLIEFYKMKDQLAEANNERDRLAERVAVLDYQLAARGQADPEKDPEPGWSEWIEWGGGECPVQPETRVCIRVRDGWEDWEENAGYWKWKHLGAGGDIIAYRVRKGGSK